MVKLKNYFHFEKHALESIDVIIQRLSSSFVSVENREFQKACALEVSNLPSQLREYLTKIASNLCNEGYYVLSGFKIDDEKIGDSPAHWDAPWENPRYLREEIFQCLISSAIGSLFGWRTQENGRLLRHIVPIKSDENEQLGGSSKTPLFLAYRRSFSSRKSRLF